MRELDVADVVIEYTESKVLIIPWFWLIKTDCDERGWKSFLYEDFKVLDYIAANTYAYKNLIDNIIVLCNLSIT